MNAQVKAAAIVPADPHRLKLTKPIATHQGNLHELVFRDPIAEDFVTVNDMPFTVVGQGEDKDLKFNFRASMAWMVRLSGLGELELKDLCRRDWLQACGSIAQIIMLDVADPKN